MSELEDLLKQGGAIVSTKISTFISHLVTHYKQEAEQELAEKDNEDSDEFQNKRRKGLPKPRFFVIVNKTQGGEDLGGQLPLGCRDGVKKGVLNEIYCNFKGNFYLLSYFFISLVSYFFLTFLLSYLFYFIILIYLLYL